MRSWTDTIILITGGGSGIGRATAIAMAKLGCHVAICGRHLKTLQETVSLAGSYGDNIIPIRADITSSDDITSLINQLKAKFGHLDILINNAGVLGPRTSLEKVSLNDWENTLRINATGTFLTTIHALDLLRQSTATKLIINLSSSVGRRGRGHWGPYSVAKHAIEGLTDVLADELKDDNICVISLNPGGTATPMRQDAYPDEDPSTLPSPDDIAKTIVTLCGTLSMTDTSKKYNSRDLLPKI